jgi:hypothetical protein
MLSLDQKNEAEVSAKSKPRSPDLVSFHLTSAMTMRRLSGLVYWSKEDERHTEQSHAS